MAKQVKVSTDDDMISKLPDGIRRRILFFLQLKDAVATSILSTKWKDLWTTLDSIYFDHSCSPFYCRKKYSDVTADEEERKSSIIKFSRIVNKVLLFHKAPVMKRLSLDWIEDSYMYDVHSWVSTAVLRKLQELYLSIEPVNNAPIQLPTSLFTCDTLVVLKLEGSIFIRELTSYSLPRLKTLELDSIKYENGKAIRKLVSSCPSLESLNISRPMADHDNKFIITSSTLKDLDIVHELLIDEADADKSDVYVISTPGLQNLYLILRSATGLFVENLSSVVNVNLKFYGSLDIGPYENISNLLQGIRNVKILNIDLFISQSTIPVHLFPKFDSVSTLKMATICCNWDWLQEFIRNSDKLETLCLTKDHYCKKETHVICWRNPEIVPTCLLSSLKEMSFHGLNGVEDELEMVEYILKNAKVLQKMEIKLQDTLPRKIVIQLIQKLLKFPTGSEQCQVIIS